MNICVITSLYPVVGRNDIKTDTQAIHLLLKYLKPDNNIYVFNISRVSPRDFIFSIIHNTKTDSLYNQYKYTIDGIEVSLLRYRAYPKQKTLTKKQTNVVRQKIKDTLENIGFKPDIVVVHIPSVFPDILEGLFNCVKKVGILHRTDINVISGFPEMVNKINQQYNVIACRSNTVKQRAEELGLKIDNRIAFSGIPKKYIDINYTHKFNNLKSCINLLYVGKLIKRKHPEYLIKLCSDLNNNGINVRVCIIGEGPLKNKIDSMIKSSKHKDKIEMINHVSRENIQKYMKKADIFILPSVNETLGLVYLEAMAAGCITIGVFGEGIDGIIENNVNGYLIKPEDYNSLLKCLNFIIKQDKLKIQEISKNAIEMASSIPEEEASKNYFLLMN